MKFENLDNCEEVLLNNVLYKIAYFFESKEDPSVKVPLKNNCVLSFSYFDDIANVGLTGLLHIRSDAGLFNNILNYTDKFYIGFYSEDISSAGQNVSGHKESIYFSIVKSEIIESSITATSSEYKLYLQEAFMVNAASKGFKFMRSGITDGISFFTPTYNKSLGENLNILKSGNGDDSLAMLEDRNLHSLALLTIGLSIANLAVSKDTQSGADLSAGFFTKGNAPDFVSNEKDKRIIDIDEIAVKYFKDNFATDTIGEKLYDNITNKDTCLSVLDTINRNYFTRAIEGSKNGKTTAVSNLMGDFALARNENVSYLPFMLPEIYNECNLSGERQFTIKNIATLLKLAFKDKIVYEKLIKKDSETIPNPEVNAAFIKKVSFNQNIVYPVNTTLILDTWADTIIEPLDNDDSTFRTFLRFTDVLDYFEKTHLNSDFESNIEKNLKKSKALRSQDPCYDSDDLKYTVCSKIIKSFFTLNEMTSVILPGYSYRKANEIIFVDPNILKANINESGVTTFSESLQNQYYYVTRVEHNIVGNQYTNTLSLCSFCQKTTDKK